MTTTPTSVYTVRFSDCDLFGHLNNARYIDYFLNAREDHLKHYHNLNLEEFYQNNIAWVVGGHEIAYLRPALYNETITIQSTLLKADTEYLLVETQMKNENQNHLKAIMRTRFVPVNTKTGRKIPHEPSFMEWAKTIENREVAEYTTLQERIEQLI
ncbi:acyl-CoA thioesterase [Flavobacterium phycosphaerae]|uniref:acyl-CoA thioesterase n=1 Tax=Flavobacterium phycosphaerae TaxID=2697515 RepID=UPI00138A4BBF|nr:acyl-CoA thioesterase [Flavobacterium phycosphaerae]